MKYVKIVHLYVFLIKIATSTTALLSLDSVFLLFRTIFIKKVDNFERRKRTSPLSEVKGMKEN